MFTVKIGSDPEFFLEDKAGKIVSAHGIIPGTKAKPHSVGRGGAIQVDGMALEVNTNPELGAADFYHSIEYTLSALRSSLPPGYKYAIKSWHDFGEDYINSQPPEAKELGCDPDYNAWTGERNEAPDASDTIRTASGHVHIGWTEEEIADEWFMNLCCGFTKQLDCILGLFSVLEDRDNTRKRLYGKAGAFRPKPYGLEYRVLSNYWLKNRRSIMNIWNRAYTAFRHYEGGIKFVRHLNSFNLSEEEVRGLVSADIPLTSLRAKRVRNYLNFVISI